MADAQCIITDPTLLQESLKPPGDSTSQMKQVTLALLQPLANADMLNACRDPGSNCLNIQPLSKAWRQALMKVPPISHLTFDLTLPKEGLKNGGAFRIVYQDVSMPNQASLRIVTMDVKTLVTTIATGTRMRADGHVQFEVLYDEADGVQLVAVMRLKEQLRVLAKMNNRPCK